jgi:septal ring factor EnvC (AmiA/AmiB activator)
MTNEITGTEEILDTRDIDARIEELENERDSLVDEQTEAQTILDDLEGEPDSTEDELAEAQDEVDRADDALDEWTANYGDELTELQRFADEAQGCCPDWHYGEALISDDYFEEYAEQLAYDIGAVDPKAHWPTNHIDWEAAAESLQQDYTAVDLFGNTYWVL